MFRKISANTELDLIKKELDPGIMPKLTRCVDTFERFNRRHHCDTIDRGGYCLIAECEEDLGELELYVDIERRIPECTGSAGENYTAAVYNFKDELLIVVFLPKQLADQTLCIVG